MKSNLKRALESKRITNHAVCEMLGISEKTLYNKMSGSTEFTVEEALKIVRNLLPEYTFEFLFESEGGGGDDAPADG